VNKQKIVAVVILAVVVVWMVIPRTRGPSDITAEAQFADERRVQVIGEDQLAGENPDIITVRAAAISAQTYTEQVRVRGRTQAFRHVQVRAEQAGRIVTAPVQRGAQVAQGDVLCEIAIDTRESDVLEAIARRQQAELELQAARDLLERGLQSDVTVSQLNAALEASKAAVVRAELALTNTKVRAPFSGSIETRTVEVGDYLERGGVCASVLDDKPMLLVGLVPEQLVSKIAPGSKVSAELLTGEIVAATVIYVSRAADPISRSYRMEAEIAADGQVIRDGITAELFVEGAEINAYQIPSSALTLDDNGLVGVKLVEPDKTISFATVTLVGDNTSELNPGVWVTGLSGTVNLVTHGQEIVFPGQVVESDFQWSVTGSSER